MVHFGFNGAFTISLEEVDPNQDLIPFPSVWDGIIKLSTTQNWSIYVCSAISPTAPMASRLESVQPIPKLASLKTIIKGHYVGSPFRILGTDGR
jgi:hypothetical protein